MIMEDIMLLLHVNVFRTICFFHALLSLPRYNFQRVSMVASFTLKTTYHLVTSYYYYSPKLSPRIGKIKTSKNVINYLNESIPSPYL